MPDGFKTFLVTFPAQDIAQAARAEIGKAEISFAVNFCPMPPGGILCEGNDEMWEHIQKVPPEMNKALAHISQVCSFVLN